MRHTSCSLAITSALVEIDMEATADTIENPQPVEGSTAGVPAATRDRPGPKETIAQRDARVIQLVYDVSRDWHLSKAEGPEREAAASRYDASYANVVRDTIAFYPCESSHAWAAITIDGTVTTSAPSVWPPALWPDGKDVWLTAENLYALAKRFLDDEGAFYLRVELAAIQGDLLTLIDRDLDSQAASSALESSRKRIETAKANCRIGALSRATSRYLQGMLIGLAVTAPLAIVFGWLIGNALPWEDLVLGATACAIAGQFGALVSVLTRISGNGLDLDYRAGDRMLRVVGFARPVLGAIFASALYFATVGGIVPLKAPTEPLMQFAFFIGIGFLAGFSERYAQDMLSVTPKDEAPAAATSTAPV